MYPSDVDVIIALEKAAKAWKQVFFVDGHGRSFDKYSVDPEPAAMAMLAGFILTAEALDRNVSCKTDPEAV